MVKVFKPKKNTNKGRHGPTIEVDISAVDHEGKGIAKSNPITFVDGALPGERCVVQVTRSQKQVQFGTVKKVLNPSSARHVPPCEQFAQCGGCQTQFCEPSHMIAFKQSALGALIEKLAAIPQQELPWQETISAGSEHYRRKVRLAVDCRDKQDIKLGFRGKDGKSILNIPHCLVVTEAINKLLSPLKGALKRLSARRHIGHIGLFDNDQFVQVTLRMTQALSEADRALLSEFAKDNQCQVVAEDNEHKLHVISHGEVTTEYPLSVSGEQLKIAIEPTDFVQVNGEVNQKMVAQALDWLDLSATDQCLDLFCGVGNFTLPMATSGADITGFEVSAEMVQRAKNNAHSNGIHNLNFVCGDLANETTLKKLHQINYNKVLLDPARAGAYEAIKHIVKKQPEAVLYVSCNPATFGRDIALLVAHHYRLTKISLLDMFPYTSHTEVMALFSLDKQ